MANRRKPLLEDEHKKKPSARTEGLGRLIPRKSLFHTTVQLDQVGGVGRAKQFPQVCFFYSLCVRCTEFAVKLRNYISRRSRRSSLHLGERGAKQDTHKTHPTSSL